ncbi:MAG: hypothetical protein AAGU27_14465 [Dehalobacterium sp.]
MPIWLVVLASFVIPGSGYVILGKPVRGLMMVFWMLLFGFVTYNLTSEEISFIGRLSGGIAVWTLSLVEVYRIAKNNYLKKSKQVPVRQVSAKKKNARR